MIRLTDEKCARCTNKLATSNKSKDRLCGECQRELGGGNSLALRTWKANGRKREITREAPNGAAAPSPITAALTLDTPTLMELAARATAELDRRRREAEELLRLLSGGGATAPSHEPG